MLRGMTSVTFRRPHKVGNTTYQPGDVVNITDPDVLRLLLVSKIAHHTYDPAVRPPAPATVTTATVTAAVAEAVSSIISTDPEDPDALIIATDA